MGSKGPRGVAQKLKRQGRGLVSIRNGGVARFDSIRLDSCVERGAAGQIEIVGRGGRGEEAQEEVERFGSGRCTRAASPWSVVLRCRAPHKMRVLALFNLAQRLALASCVVSAAPRASRRVEPCAAATSSRERFYFYFLFFFRSCVATLDSGDAGGRAGNVQLRRLSSRCGRLPRFRGCASLIQANPVRCETTIAQSPLASQ